MVKNVTDVLILWSSLCLFLLSFIHSSVCVYVCVCECVCVPFHVVSTWNICLSCNVFNTFISCTYVCIRVRKSEK